MNLLPRLTKTLPLVLLLSQIQPAGAVTPTTPIYALSQQERQTLRSNGAIASMQLKKDFGSKILASVAKNSLASAPKTLTAEKRAQIIANVIRTFELKYGIAMDEFKRSIVETKVSDVLAYAQQYHLIPDSILVGAFGHAQVGVGMGYGMEWNAYVDPDKDSVFSLAQYKNYGLAFGEEASVGEDYYVMLCYGACYGDEREGYYLGVDLGGSSGVGMNMMAEVGTDMSALISSSFRDWRSVVDNAIVTLGFGLTLGVGAGASVVVNYYTLDWIKRFGTVDTAFNYLIQN